MATYLNSNLRRNKRFQRSVRYLLCVANELRDNFELQQDVERLGGVIVEEGFQFASRRGRNVAAAIISQRWGIDATELLDLSEPLLDDSCASCNTPRLLLVSLGEDRLLDWFNFLRNRSFDVQLSTHGLQCSETLKSFQPNVMLIDEELLWGPRTPTAENEFRPLRIAFLSGDDWPRRNSLKPQAGGSLPAATDPHELLEQLHENCYLAW